MKGKAYEAVSVLVLVTLAGIVLLSGPLNLQPEYTIALALLFVGVAVASTVAMAAADLRTVALEVSEYQHRSRQEAVDRDWEHGAAREYRR